MQDDNEETSAEEVSDDPQLNQGNTSNEDDASGRNDDVRRPVREISEESRSIAGSDVIKLKKKGSPSASKASPSVSTSDRDIKQLSEESQRLHMSKSINDDIDEKEFLDILFFVDSESKTARSSTVDLDVLARQRLRFKEEFRARRTEVDDVQYIDILTGPTTYLLFGRVNLYDLIEKAILAISLEQSGVGVVAHAAFSDSPNLKSVVASEWEQWLENYVGKNEYVYTPLNTVFLQYFVADEAIESKCLSKLMHAAFSTLLYVKYIVLVIPERMNPILGPSICSIFQMLPPGQPNEVSQQYSLMVCKRDKVMPGLNIRIARVEDSDDLVELFGKLAIVLKKSYGEYFIAELIEHQDQLDRCLVAETKQGIPVGFISISRNVDVKLLNQFFDLTPYCHLKRLYRKPEVVEVKIEPVKAPPKKKKGKKGAEEEVEEKEKEKESHPVPSPAKEEEEAKHVEEKERKSLDTKISDTSLPDEGDVFSYGELKELMKQSKKLIRSVQLVPEHPLSPKTSREDVEEGNTFCIHLFVVSSEYEYGFVPLLEEAFRLYSDLEWCVISAASWSGSSPLFQLFARTSPKSKLIFPEDLYVFHRWGLLKTINVRSGHAEDMEKVQEFVKSVTGFSHLIDEFRKYIFNQRSKEHYFAQIFLLECKEGLIGCSIIAQEESIEYLRSHFNIEEYIYFGLHRREDHAVLTQFLINPIFSHYTRFFLKEVLRLANKTCLYIKIYSEYLKYETKSSCLTAIEEFIPVTTRKVLNYDSRILEENIPSLRCTGYSPPKFTLGLLSKKYVMENKIPIRARVVIVGASATALWLLKNFLESPSLKFLNICLVSTHGLEELSYHGVFEVLHQGKLLGPLRYVNPLLIKTWVSTSSSKMKVIYREQKFIELEDKSEIAYDYLVLCCGKQYYVPTTLMSSISEEVQRSRIFLMNNDADCIKLLQWLQDNELESDEFLVVYGNNLKAYSLLAGLLLVGVSGYKIKMVGPIKRTEDFCLDEPSIFEAFQFLLKEAGVDFYRNYSLTNVTLEKTTFSCTDRKQPNLSFKCKMLFYFADKNVDYETFLAINNASLVYDGGLVINHEFRTNDPWILAAGPMTKFSRRFYTPVMEPLLRLSSEKSGELLAARLREVLDPTFDPKNHHLCSDASEVITALHKATPEVSWLPGNKCFFHVCRSSNCDVRKKGHQLKELITGSVEQYMYPYVKICINSCNNVESVTCFHDQRIDFNIFLRIFEINEAFLNHLKSRYDAGEVEDLYSYFTDPWSYALLHDRFREYWDEARKLISRKIRSNSMLSGLLYRISLLPSNEYQLNSYYRKEFQNLMAECEVTKEIEAVLLSFLQYNQSLLPMYALPDQIHGRTEEM